MDQLGQLKGIFGGKVVVLGIGNTLRGDDAVGSLLAARLKGRIPCIVYDGGSSPENYLEKIVKDFPATVLLVDSADFGAKPGELKVIAAGEIATSNLFSTHNGSISLLINYLKNNSRANIIALIVQPASIAFSDKLSPTVEAALGLLERWFINETAKEKG